MPEIKMATATPIMNMNFMDIGAKNYLDGFWAVMSPNIGRWAFSILAGILVFVICWFIYRFIF